MLFLGLENTKEDSHTSTATTFPSPDTTSMDVASKPVLTGPWPLTAGSSVFSGHGQATPDLVCSSGGFGSSLESWVH